jgi:hypothetical protein
MLRQTQVFAYMKKDDPERYMRLEGLCGRTYFDPREVYGAGEWGGTYFDPREVYGADEFLVGKGHAWQGGRVGNAG